MNCVVETVNLRKVYGSVVALDDVSISVEAGSVYGLVGPNGAGKSTLLNLLAGLRQHTAGSVRVGVERSRVAVMPDTPQFEPWLTAREVVELARSLVMPELPTTAVDGALAEAGLTGMAERRVGGFSRGMLQRLGLAATIVAEPELLILDEPAAALDPLGRHQVLQLISRLARRGTVLFSSHILADVQRVCDTVGILRHGQLLFEGPLDQLLTERVHPGYVIRLRSQLGSVAEMLRAEPWVERVDATGANELRVGIRSLADAERGLAPALARAGAPIISVEPEEADLEQVFLELTGPPQQTDAEVSPA